MKIACQFVNPNTGLRSKAFDGTWREILGALTKLRELHEQEQPEEEVPFDNHFVLILWEQPEDSEGFFSQRPMLTVPHFEEAVTNVIMKEEQTLGEKHAG